MNIIASLMAEGYTFSEIMTAIADTNIEIPPEAEQFAKEFEDLIVDGLEDLDISQSGLLKDLALLATLFGFFAAGSAKADAGDIDKALDNLAKKPAIQKIYDIQSNFKEGQKGAGHGNYRIEVGPYVIKGTYYGAGAMSNHKLQTFVKKNATEEELEEYRPFHDKMVKLLQGVDLKSVDVEKEEKKRAQKQEKEENKKAKKIVDKGNDDWDSYSDDADKAWDSYTSNF